MEFEREGASSTPSARRARTHLQRMFEKTGVRSQPALVRMLLSVASPLA
jgi:hypothetical protein